MTLTLPDLPALDDQLALAPRSDQDIQFYTNGFELLPVEPEDPMIPDLWLSVSEARSKGSADGWFVSPDMDFVTFSQYREGYFQGFKSRLRAIATGYIPGSAGILKAAIQPLKRLRLRGLMGSFLALLLLGEIPGSESVG